ncbi:hypothetical protein [Streptomyces sp. AC558_RSS880]|uniref:hypothetical protein n=1 Tax=Streptomyces sp. AC558_RSS880 TaxID=2823687 RepID=UPI001C228B3C|nr:hypothetical protein [Streptomyces sp. AC558_RSS880]
MKFKSAIACAFVALAVAGGAAGTAQAADDDPSNLGSNEQVQSCEVNEGIDQSNFSSSDNDLDCSKHIKKETDLVRVVDDALLPRHDEHR